MIDKTIVLVALIIFSFFTCVGGFMTYDNYMHYSRIKQINRYELNVKFGPGHQSKKLIFEEHVIE